MSKIYRKYKKETDKPGVKKGFFVAVGLITGGIAMLLGGLGVGGLYMWLQSL